MKKEIEIEKTKKNKKMIFGFIFTIIMFFIVDTFASNVHLLVRIIIVLVLLLFGQTIFNTLFLKIKHNRTKK